MEKKYYVPEISEFHVGFEFQIRGDAYKVGGSKDEWHDLTFGLPNVSILLNANTEFLRVKCLDADDISSLGFQAIKKDSWNEKRIYDMEGNFVGAFDENEEYNIEIYNTYFKIKNKSELARILRQVGVIKTT